MLTSIFGDMKSIRLRNKLMDFTEPKIMGIINVTPDSFYGGSRVDSVSALLSKAEAMANEGVDVFDVGGYSTRPGAAEISVTEEIDRVSSSIEVLKKHFPEIPISIDTFRASVAKEAIYNGAEIINDISGGALDSAMFPLVAELQVPYILMHMRGNPKNMQEHTNYQNLLKDILFDLADKVKELRSTGVKDIIVDPGIGFAKNIDQNFELIKELKQFQILGCPILIGISRKSFIYKTLKITAEDSLNATTALHTFALLNGASILRVHDVKEANEVKELIQKLI